MFYEAYNDMTDLDDDGKIDFIFNPAVTYDGIFESNLCYKYDENVFKIDSLATSTSVNYHGRNSIVYTCNGTYSGNFMNYLTSSRLDLVKRILIGGQRLVKTASGNGVKSQTARYVVVAVELVDFPCVFAVGVLDKVTCLVDDAWLADLEKLLHFFNRNLFLPFEAGCT